MGGTIGVSALGAVLANRMVSSLGGASGDGGSGVPEISKLPVQARIAVQEAYGNATADLFIISVLALGRSLSSRRRALLTTSRSERMATENPEEAAGKVDS